MMAVVVVRSERWYLVCDDVPMFPDVPLTGAEDLQSSGVNHDVPRLFSGPGAKLNLKVTLTLTHGREIRNRQVHTHQPHDRFQEALGSPEG